MGGDFGVPVAVDAALAATKTNPLLEISLVGDADAIAARVPADHAFTIVDAQEVIEMTDSVADALRRKRGSSLHVALQLLRDGTVDGVVSAGNTAALLAVGRQLLGTVEGVSRPAICSKIPARGGHVWLLDLGANISPDAHTLHHFARMGSALAAIADNNTAPDVALLNIGTEDGKGVEVVQEAATLLRADSSITFTGFIEGDQIFTGGADVVVCDGFSGNIALKVCEGTAGLIGEIFETSLSDANMSDEVLAAVTPAFKSFFAAINPHSYAGASFLGLNGVLVKTHGNSGVGSFSRAIELAAVEAAGELPLKLARQLAAS